MTKNNSSSTHSRSPSKSSREYGLNAAGPNTESPGRAQGHRRDDSSSSTSSGKSSLLLTPVSFDQTRLLGIDDEKTPTQANPHPRVHRVPGHPYSLAQTIFDDDDDAPDTIDEEGIFGLTGHRHLTRPRNGSISSLASATSASMTSPRSGGWDLNKELPPLPGLDLDIVQLPRTDGTRLMSDDGSAIPSLPNGGGEPSKSGSKGWLKHKRSDSSKSITDLSGDSSSPTKNPSPKKFGKAGNALKRMLKPAAPNDVVGELPPLRKALADELGLDFCCIGCPELMDREEYKSLAPRMPRTYNID